jgi:hypothetical protein
MAVELRCPECKTKLRLPVQPEPDSEIECPKCEHVFPCDENIIHAGAKDDRPKKKKPADAEEPKKAAPQKAVGEEGKQFKRKKKKSKKRKTSPWVIAAIVGGVLTFLSFAGAIVWFFTKKSSFQEMITYLPDDCDTVAGLNLGHLRKYPEFYKSCQPAFANSGFKKAGDTLAVALGSKTIDDVVDYVVQGTGYVGGQPSGARLDATVFKTTEEYDPAALAKIPGAREGSLDGVKYYAIPNISELGYPSTRVFGPTNRIVVFCSGAIPEAKFKTMLKGNKDNEENTSYTRAGSLAKQTIRGTAWRFHIEGRASPGFSNAPVFPPGDSEDSKLFAADWGPVVQGMKGIGIKASVGSRDVRGEVIIKYADSETASGMYNKWKEKTWVKDSEADVPKWFKTLAGKSGAGRTATNVVRDGISFRSSGDLFVIRCEVETKLIQQSAASIAGEFTRPGGQFGMPGGPGLPGGGMPMPGGVPGPGGRRRRLLTPR